MAKKAAAEPKSAAPQPSDSFVQLMLVAAEFVKSCGGMAQAKKALHDAGNFINHAGSAAKADKALGVLESLKEKIA